MAQVTEQLPAPGCSSTSDAAPATESISRSKTSKRDKIPRYVISYLPSFITNFPARGLKYCLLCREDLQGNNSISPPADYKDLMELCIKSMFTSIYVDFQKGQHPWMDGQMINGPRGTSRTLGSMDTKTKFEVPSVFPFCKKCTGPVRQLMELYEELLAIRHKLNETRAEVLSGVAKTYIRCVFGAGRTAFSYEDGDEELVVQCWKESVGLSDSNKDDSGHKEERNETGTVAAESEGPIPKLSKDEMEVDLSLVKHEDDDEELDVDVDDWASEEMKDFIITPECLLDDVDMNPVVRMERLEDDSLRKPVLRQTRRRAASPKTAISSLSEDGVKAESEDIDYEPDQDFELEPESPEEYQPPYYYMRKQQPSRDEGNSFDNSYNTSPAEQVKRKYTRRKPLKQKKPKSPKSKPPKKPPTPKEKRNPDQPKKKRVRKQLAKLQCPVCSKIVTGPSYLRIHMRLHTGEKPFKCTVCPKAFYKSSNLSKHKVVHYGESSKKYKCTDCESAFATGTDLRVHRAAKHQIFDGVAHLCPAENCSMKFLRRSGLKRHFDMVHDPDRSHAVRRDVSGRAMRPTRSRRSMKPRRTDGFCDVCRISFGSTESLDEHNKNETEEHQQKRRMLDLLCATPTPIRVTVSTGTETKGANGGDDDDTDLSLQGFMDKYLSNAPPCFTDSHEEDKNFSKAQAQAKTTTRTTLPSVPRPRLSSHRINAQSVVQGKRTYKCGICGEQFPDYSSAMKHSREVHQIKGFECEICGKTIADRGNFRTHVLAHRNDKPFSCTMCDLTFKHSYSLKHHMVSHTGVPFFNCNYCKEGYNQQRKLREHLCKSHPEEHLKTKKFACTAVCFMNFATEEEFKTHMTTHDKHKCIYCGKMFKETQKLKRHILTHTGEKPYICEICGKAFNSESNLREHRFRHTGERPFRCDVCGDGFLRNKEFRTHMEKAHGVIISINASSTSVMTKVNSTTKTDVQVDRPRKKRLSKLAEESQNVDNEVEIETTDDIRSLRRSGVGQGVGSQSVSNRVDHVNPVSDLSSVYVYPRFTNL